MARELTARGRAVTIIEAAVVANAITHRIELESTTTSLDALRDHLHLIKNEEGL